MPDLNAYEIVKMTNRDEWNQFVLEAEGGTVFSTAPWLESAELSTGDPIVCYGCYKKGQLVAGISGLERRGGSQLVTPPLLPHGGFLHRPVSSNRPFSRESERGGETRALITYLENHYQQIHLTMAPAIMDVREFVWAGWEIAPRYTYVNDLTIRREKVWERLERRTRNVIRKAESDGFKVEPTTDIDEIKHQYELVYSEQKQQPPVHPMTVQKFAETAQKRGLIDTFRAVSSNGQTVSIVAFARSCDCLYAWISGADPAYRDTGATSLLYWKVLELTECPRFDFVGANIPSIAFFKRGFAGELVSYYAVEGCPNRLLKLTTAVRRIIKNR